MNTVKYSSSDTSMDCKATHHKASADAVADSISSIRTGKSSSVSSEAEGSDEKCEALSTSSAPTDELYKLSSPPPYLSVQPYISSFLSHRSKRHIRDSREYDVMPHASRSLLEVCVGCYDFESIKKVTNYFFLIFIGPH